MSLEAVSFPTPSARPAAVVKSRICRHNFLFDPERKRPFPRQYRDITLGDVEIEHEIEQTKWEASQDCKDLEELVRSMDDGAKVITNIVYLAVGSFHEDDPYAWDPSDMRSHKQLAELNTIRKLLSTFFLFST